MLSEEMKNKVIDVLGIVGDESIFGELRCAALREDSGSLFAGLEGAVLEPMLLELQTVKESFRLGSAASTHFPINLSASPSSTGEKRSSSSDEDGGDAHEDKAVEKSGTLEGVYCIPGVKEHAKLSSGGGNYRGNSSPESEISGDVDLMIDLWKAERCRLKRVLLQIKAWTSYDQVRFSSFRFHAGCGFFSHKCWKK